MRLFWSTTLLLLLLLYLKNEGNNDGPRRILPTAAAFSTTTTSMPQATSPTSKSLSPNQRALDAMDNFPRTWVPLASVFELDPDRPTALQFLGQRYVTYQARAGDDSSWVVVDESCPHRLAPLSEGRIDRCSESGTAVLECAYHGWAFDGASGDCLRIPQITAEQQARVVRNPASRVRAYPVQVLKNVLWAWLWPDDVLSALQQPEALPERMLEGVPLSTTYTRDLPYGWDTLLENLVDPAHVPWAHHGLQGTREDSVPINMTSPMTDLSRAGFSYEFGDRTMGKYRQGTAFFRAPFLLKYSADFLTDPPRPFDLTTICAPIRPGWSRLIIFIALMEPDDKKKVEEDLEKGDQLEDGTGGQVEGAEKNNAKETKKFSPVSLLFRLLPTSLVHLLNNRFLDSDLAFLHYQEQERARRRRLTGALESDGYFMPAAADRCVSAMRRWVNVYASSALPGAEDGHGPPPLPEPVYDRKVLFDRYVQHTDHCRHCAAAVKQIQQLKRNNFATMGIGLVLLPKFAAAGPVTVVCLFFWRLLEAIDKEFRQGEFKHYENN